MRPFVFLDRDGTVIVQKPYLSDPADVELIDGAAHSLSALRDAGFGLAIITNQSGVGRGLFELDRVAAIHERMSALLSVQGVRLDGIEVCPHLPEEACACRKPATGLIDVLTRRHGVDRRRSFMIGDKACDVDCARNAGLTSILVRTGYGASCEFELADRVDFVADDLSDAASWILRERKRT